jgi:myo-inositol 2-dehydrogenase/D-chiro-inositol 1-dehydrogenase
MVRVGIIGAGGIAQRHLEGLLQVSNAKIVAVADIVKDKAEAAAAECGAKPTTDYREILDMVDAVYICTPPSLHREEAVAAAEAGKHIFCEKPIASSIEDAQAMVRAVRESGVKMMMGFNMRFRSPFKKLKEIYESGQVGQLVCYWTTRVGSGTPKGSNWRTTPELLCGMTVESVSHDIDLLRWICGEVSEVHGRIINSVSSLNGYDDNVCAVMALEKGGMANFNISWSSSIGFNSRGIIGTKGAACVEGPDLWTLSRVRWKAVGSESESVIEVPGVQAVDMAYREEGQHFVSCLESGEDFLVTDLDGLAALEVSLAIHESSRDGCVVKLDHERSR